MMKTASAFLCAPAPTKPATKWSQGLSSRLGSSPASWSRQSLLLISTALTLFLLVVDSALQPQDWSLTAGSEIAFYLLGLCTAFIYLQFGGGFRKPSKKSSSCGAKEGRGKLSEGGFSAGTPPSHGGFLRKSSSLAPLDKATVSLGPGGGESGTGSSRMPGSRSSSPLHSAVSAALQRDGPDAARRKLLDLEDEGAESDTRAYNLIIQGFIKRSDLQAALDTLDLLLQKGAADEQSFSSVLGFACSKDDVKCAESVVQKMLENGVKPSATAYSAIIQMHARAGNLRQGLSCLRHMKNASIVPELSCYNALIHACSLASRPLEARQCFEAMKGDGLKPSVMTFTALIDVSAKALDLKAAEAWMDEMSDLGIEPNVVSYSAMISACAKVGDLKRAEKWYNKMHERGVEPNAYSYSALINACAKVGDVNAASAWLERGEQAGTAFDAVVYSCVINCCARGGDAERAMAAFDKMRARNIPSNIIIYSALARPFAYRGDWAKVESIAEQMSAEGIDMNDYFLYTLLLAYSRAKPRESARAERAFVQAVKGSNIAVNDRLKKVLASAVGYGRSTQLIQKLSF
eukprot:TRINITY_DN104271_c0_g1_i1.p1 TRINITY_DN104271_c0_g1~~TRINITY_DN104271_c0_g1_i1.p1  ORF type:complete len:576 (+),score=107.48 TRINITY_DN104271_c0_g1_i1:173-1900(+)